MKALTLHQPWATLVAEGVKTIETRSWSTPHRGPLAIHAAAKRPARAWFGWDGPPSDDPRDLVAMFKYYCITESRDGGDFLYEWCGPLGAVVATCTLVDCIPTEALTWVPHDGISGARAWGVGDRCAVVVEDQRPFGDFTPGRWAWLLDDIVRLDEPVPAKGAQRLWEWSV